MKHGIHGIDKLQKSLRAHEKAVGVAFRAGLKDGADFLKVESQKLVPYDTGELEASAHTRMEGRGLSPVAVVAYGVLGDDGGDYAVVQHENLEFKHLPGRQAKYLEAPARGKARQIADIVWLRTKGALGKVHISGGVR